MKSRAQTDPRRAAAGGAPASPRVAEPSGLDRLGNGALNEVLSAGTEALSAWADILPEVELPRLGWPDLSPPEIGLPDLELPDLGLPDVGDWIGDWIGGPDEGRSEIPERGAPIFPIFGPDLPEPGPRNGDEVVQEHLPEYVALVELAFEDPSLGALDCGEAAPTLSQALIDGWVRIGGAGGDARTGILAVEDALHGAAMAALVGMHPDPKEQRAISASFGRVAHQLLESTVYSRIASPASYGLEYPTGAQLGVEGVDVGGALAEGRDETVVVGPDGEPIPAEAPFAATPEARASHLASLLAHETLPAEHLAGAHEDVELLYAGPHAAVLAEAGLPATAAEVYRQLQDKSAFANQRDNANRKEEGDGGTCNLTAVAMAMQAAGVTAPHEHRGVVLEGMQFEERLVAIAYQDGFKGLTSAATWEHVVRACGGTWVDLRMNGQSTWEQWQAVQTEHLDQGHGVIVSNNGHVLRIQAVTELGLTIDDPYSQGHVKGTEAHPGAIRARYHYEPPPPPAEGPDEEVEAEAPEVEEPAVVEDREVSFPVWSKGDKLWARYDSETETFSEELTLELQDQRLREAAAAETETAAGGWSLAEGSRIRFGGNQDRAVGDRNTRDRDRDEADYDQGDDTTWSKDDAVAHYMNGVWAIHR